MSTKAKKGFMIILIIVIAICFLTVVVRPDYSAKKAAVDTSVMGDEIPIKITILHSSKYILGDKGNLYELNNEGKYYVDLWYPEFWKDIEVVDICAGGNGLYALALSQDGKVYVWDWEYEFDDKAEYVKKEDWKIQQVENIPEVDEIFATYNRFLIVTKEGAVYSWNPVNNVTPDMDDMEMIEMERPILSVAGSKEEMFILDRDNVLWSIENGTKKVLKENVKNIVQSVKGFAMQMSDNENEVYIYNARWLGLKYETVMFADKYEVSKIVFEGETSSLSVSSKTAVVCVDNEKFYRWGKKGSGHPNVGIPDASRVYEEPVEVDLKDAKYYKVVGTSIFYIDNQNRMFVLYYW